MKKIHWYAAGLFVLSMLIIPCSAMAFFGVDIGVGYWQQDPSGGMSYKAIDPVTDRLDLKNDLFFDKQNKPFVRAKVELPLILPNIYFMATPMKFEGSGTLSRTIHWGDKTFSGGAPISSRLKLDHYDFTLYYPIPLLKAATLNTLSIELGLNARKIDFEGTITGTAGGSTETASKSNTLYVPMIYAGIIVKPIDLLSIEFEARGISYGSNHYYDYIGRLRVNPIPLVFIAGGYRSESVKIDESDVLADIKFSGPFIEAGVHF
jgi:outer membrane protein